MRDVVSRKCPRPESNRLACLADETLGRCVPVCTPGVLYVKEDTKEKQLAAGYGQYVPARLPGRSRTSLPAGSAAWMAPIRAVRHAASGIQKQYGKRSDFIVTIPEKIYFFCCFRKHGVCPAFFVTVLRIAVLPCVFYSRHYHQDTVRLLFAAFSRISASTSTFRMQYRNLRPRPYHRIQAAASARDGSAASRAWAVPSSTSSRGSFSADQPSQPPVFNAAKSLNLGSRCLFRRQIADWHSALTVLGAPA